MVIKKKAKTRRQKTKYPALDPTKNLKSRHELITDYDYLNQLNETEKAWLNKFTEEYVNDVLDRKDLSNNLHNTKSLKKDCGDRNNARNRDIYLKAKINKKLINDYKKYFESEKRASEYYEFDYEEYLIEMLFKTNEKDDKEQS